MPPSWISSRSAPPRRHTCAVIITTPAIVTVLRNYLDYDTRRTSAYLYGCCGVCANLRYFFDKNRFCILMPLIYSNGATKTQPQKDSPNKMGDNPHPTMWDLRDQCGNQPTTSPTSHIVVCGISISTVGTTK
ncbi:hypothetical protein EVAR_14564_1 [Eumeta japonica]|uniref:Uncharacterized protein n=1 Tax=Eumeta variegata TaxID=151549 RepID=A0A4C1UVK7_EUMVA|nr:hypothetical protein EVAR_14564_1 [Eumeta japonica]